jgi:hypothetical protein
MKKTAGKIAMLLIIVMLVNCFTGCQGLSIDFGFLKPIGYAFVGIMVVAGVVGFITGIMAQDQLEKRGPRRTNPYLFEDSAFTTTIMHLPREELDSMTKTFYSLPEKELNGFMWKLNSMSETEAASLMEAVNAFSEEELAVMVEAFNSMPETEIISSLQVLNSLPETVSLAHIIRNTAFSINPGRK